MKAQRGLEVELHSVWTSAMDGDELTIQIPTAPYSLRRNVKSNQICGEVCIR